MATVAKIQHKFARTPTEFGAVVDGVSDDLARINDMVADVIATGREYVGFGRRPYFISGQIDIDDATGLVLDIGAARIFRTGSSAACIFRLLNSTDITIKGEGVLDGGYTGVSTGSNPVIQIGVAGTSGMLNRNIHIKGLSIRNGNHACIGIYGETDTGTAGNKEIFINDVVLDRAGAGIFVYKGLEGLFFNNVYAKNCGNNGLVLDTRAATDADTVNSFPIRHVRGSGLHVHDVAADTGFEPRAGVIKGAVSDVIIDGYDIKNITSEDGAARNTYGFLIAASFGPGTGAVATANLTGDVVSSFTVSDGGSGYTAPPVVFISSATGSGAVGTAVLTGDAVTSITVDSGGEGYADAPYVQLIAGEVGEDIHLLNGIIENVNDLDGTTGWPVYVQSGFRDVFVKNVRLKDCKRGINVDAADSVHIDGVVSRDLPLQASTYPVQIAGVSATAPATNITIDHIHADKGAGLATAAHAMLVNFADGVRIGKDCTQRGFDTALAFISSTNAKRVSGCLGSGTVDPANLVDGAGATNTVSCPGATLGDFVEAAFSLPLQGITMTAWVSAANVVSVRFQNETGGTIDLASGTMWVRTTRP